MDPVSNGAVAAVARNGVTIKDAKDFVGKKVGAPGIGAFLHVLFRKWLIDKGVDPKSVNFVEVTFPTMSDALKSGRGRRRADRRAVRLAHQGGGGRRGRGALRCRTRAHRADHFLCRRRAPSPRRTPRSIKAFRDAIEEAAPIVNSDREKASVGDRQVHQAADRNRPPEPSQSRDAGVESHRISPGGSKP